MHTKTCIDCNQQFEAEESWKQLCYPCWKENPPKNPNKKGNNLHEGGLMANPETLSGLKALRIVHGIPQHAMLAMLVEEALKRERIDAEHVLSNREQYE